ncbi:hypothetical protein GCM10022393_37470 [Aquimarina addita]|uniref:GLPGLI family protein n=1 Tax=Aquimarina addita TaxID=870485 RepID=A0ABP6UVQ8_9FLAO
MKNLKLFTVTLLFLTTTLVKAQHDNKQIIQETITKQYEVEKGASTIPYKVHIKNKETSEVLLKKEDQNALNQERINTPEMITKIIRIDDDADHYYDNLIELSYAVDDDADFKIVPTKNGFVITVKGKELNYDFMKKEYQVEKLDNNFFKIEKIKESK